MCSDSQEINAETFYIIYINFVVILIFAVIFLIVLLLNGFYFNTILIRNLIVKIVMLKVGKLR